MQLHRSLFTAAVVLGLSLVSVGCLDEGAPIESEPVAAPTAEVTGAGEETAGGVDEPNSPSGPSAADEDEAAEGIRACDEDSLSGTDENDPCFDQDPVQ